MANFYSNINLKQNQLQYPVIHPIAVPSIGTEVPGQMYYDTDDDTMKFWGDPQSSGSYAWVSMANENTEYAAAANHGLRIVTGTSFGLDLHNMAADTSPADSDIMIVADPADNAAPKKVTLSELATALGVGGDQSLTLSGDTGTAVDSGGSLALTIADDTNGGIATAASSTTLTIAMDITDLSAATIASGDFIAFSDEGTANDPTKNTTIDNFLGVVAGTVATTGLTQSGATLVVSDLHPVGVSGSVNQLLTDDGDGTISSESSFTYDGGILKISTGGSPVDLPQIILETTDTDPNDYPIITFKKNVITEDGEDIGLISWQGGDDNSASPQTYASIRGEVADASSGQEAGSLDFRVASFDGATERGLLINGDTDADGEVDVTIAAGAASTTTVAGNLSVTTMANDGSEQTAVVTDGTTLKTRELGTAAFLNAAGLVTSLAVASDALAVNQATGAVTISLDSDQDGHISSILTTDLKIGEDSQTKIDFETANEIHFDVNNVELANFSNAAASFVVDQFDIVSTTSKKPVLQVRNANSNQYGPEIHLSSTTDNVADGDTVGTLLYKGYSNDGSSNLTQNYGSVSVNITDHVTNDPQSEMLLKVKATNEVTGLLLKGSSTVDEVDVTIGSGSGSVVTIPGNLVVTGDTTYHNETIRVISNNTIQFEGTGADDEHELNVTCVNPTADRVATFQNATGTVAYLGDITGTNSGTNEGDQLVFKTITADDGNSAVADSTADTLTLTGGTNITTSVSADEVTFNVDQVALTKKAVIVVASLTGALTTTITHGLNSQNLNVTLWEDIANGDYEQVYGTVRTIEVNKITVDFDKAPSGNVTVIMTRLSDIATIGAGSGVAYS